MTGDGIPIAVSAYGRGGASSRVRIHDWFAHLDLDYDCHEYIGTSSNGAGTILRNLPRVGAAEARLRSLRTAVSGRHLLLSREATPFSNGRLEKSLLSRAARGVYDFDDALFHDTHGLSRRVWSKQRTWSAAVVAADVVIAGSEYLAQRASELASDVVMIPSCVEPRSYTQKLDYEPDAVPRAVWIGSPSTEDLLTSVAPSLLRLHKRFGLRLTVISAGANSLGGLDAMVDRETWHETTYQSSLARADFGIMPLSDTPYTRGKCAYKLLQYGATGLPMIGSPVGANERALDLLGGFGATTDDEWYAAAVTILESSESARRALGEKARTAVTENYSFGAWATRWLSAMGLSDPRSDNAREAD